MTRRTTLAGSETTGARINRLIIEAQANIRDARVRPALVQTHRCTECEAVAEWMGPGRSVIVHYTGCERYRRTGFGEVRIDTGRRGVAVPPEAWQFRRDTATLTKAMNDTGEGSMYPEFEGDPAYEHACEEAHDRLNASPVGRRWVDVMWHYPTWSQEHHNRAAAIFGHESVWGL